MLLKNFEAKTKFLFFTGKGGVGKTTSACALAVKLAKNKKIMLVSTDPASNLQDVFEMPLDNKGTEISGLENLVVANFDPITAAEEYKESIIAPYRDLLPESALINMEEQLSGSCTVEIAAFNEFTNFVTDKAIYDQYDHIIFDTAPTGHTLRLLELPEAWSTFIDENTQGVSCLGPLSGLEGSHKVYKEAMNRLKDAEETTLMLVSRADEAPLTEANRASNELDILGIKNQVHIINGLLEESDDCLEQALYNKQEETLENMPEKLSSLPTFKMVLKGHECIGLENLMSFFDEDKVIDCQPVELDNVNTFDVLVEDLYKRNVRIVFTMGKGGVGKTTLAKELAIGLHKKGQAVHLATTNPTFELENLALEGITISYIDEKKSVDLYKEDVLNQASGLMGPDELEVLKEDLNSPCTQEIAVFRSFADIVQQSKNAVVVIDTAPTGHTLLLIESTLSYHHEMKRSSGVIPKSVVELLPLLRDPNKTEVVIVTLPESTPILEAQRLYDDLQRAEIKAGWWLVNQVLLEETDSFLLQSKKYEAYNKINQLNKNHLMAIYPMMLENKEEAV
jgi:arsenite-transporting ATPase